MKSLTWVKEKLPQGTVFPSCREGHTLTFIPTIRCLFLFGGICNTRMNELYCYDIDKNSWKVLQTTGRQPSARCNHSAFFESPYFFIYGGQGDNGRSLGDISFLNLTTWVWKKLFIMNAPPLRHCTSISDMKNSEKEKIIFGGISWPGSTLLNDVWVVNYSGVNFDSGLKDLTGTVCTLKKTKGDIPIPRKGHAATVYKNSLLIYGGKGDDPEATNWIHQLFFDTWTWKKFPGIGKPATSRHFASYCMYDEDTLMMFGGICNVTGKKLNNLYMLNLQDFHWSCPFVAGHLPTPRYGHACCVHETQFTENAVVVIGGLDTVYCNMDLYKLIETEIRDKAQWEKLVQPNYVETLASDLAGATLLDQRNYMDELEHIISKERSYGLELEQELEKLEEDIRLIQRDQKKRLETIDGNMQSLEDDFMVIEESTRSLTTAINCEQNIFGTLTKKNLHLEDVIQHTEGYALALDKLYSAITKLKIDETDDQERRLKQAMENAREEVIKSKDLHKNSLSGLKPVYDEYIRLSKQVETDLGIQRNNVLELDKSYENIIYNNNNINTEDI